MTVLFVNLSRLLHGFIFDKKGLHLCKPLIGLAPGKGFEPPTKWLTATRSAD
jgi:hypothetical protein